LVKNAVSSFKNSQNRCTTTVTCNPETREYIAGRKDKDTTMKEKMKMCTDFFWSVSRFRVTNLVLALFSEYNDATALLRRVKIIFNPSAMFSAHYRRVLFGIP